jgi:outer membrane lipoprotein-sorting protein
MFNIALFLYSAGFTCRFISAIALKAFLLFFLLLSQSVADDVLAEITRRLVKTHITQGNFQQQKHLKVLKKPLISSGSFTYDQNKGVIWKTLTPVESILLVNESRLLTDQGEQAVPAAFGKVFKAMLGGDLAHLTDGFTITGTDQLTSWQLELTPKDEMLRKVISTMVLSGDNELRGLEIRESGGNITRIGFTHVMHPEKLTAEQETDFERISP